MTYSDLCYYRRPVLLLIEVKTFYLLYVLDVVYSDHCTTVNLSVITHSTRKLQHSCLQISLSLSSFRKTMIHYAALKNWECRQWKTMLGSRTASDTVYSPMLHWKNKPCTSYHWMSNFCACSALLCTKTKTSRGVISLWRSTSAASHAVNVLVLQRAM